MVCSVLGLLIVGHGLCLEHTADTYSKGIHASPVRHTACCPVPAAASRSQAEVWRHVAPARFCSNHTLHVLTRRRCCAAAQILRVAQQLLSKPSR